MTPPLAAVPALAGLFAAAGRRRSLHPGEVLFRQGDPADRVFLIEGGQVRIVRHLASGEAAVLHTGRPGELFAEGALFAARYQCDGVAAEAAMVTACAKEDILAAFAGSPGLALELLERVTRQLHAARALVELRGVRSACERVLRHLRLRADANGAVGIEGRLLDMAAELGLTHEAYYRALAALARQGAIRRGAGRIHLLSHAPAPASRTASDGCAPATEDPTTQPWPAACRIGAALVLLLGSASGAAAQAPMPGHDGMQHDSSALAGIAVVARNERAATAREVHKTAACGLPAAQ